MDLAKDKKWPIGVLTLHSKNVWNSC